MSRKLFNHHRSSYEPGVKHARKHTYILGPGEEMKSALRALCRPPIVQTYTLACTQNNSSPGPSHWRAEGVV